MSFASSLSVVVHGNGQGRSHFLASSKVSLAISDPPRGLTRSLLSTRQRPVERAKWLHGTSDCCLDDHACPYDSSPVSLCWVSQPGKCTSMNVCIENLFEMHLARIHALPTGLIILSINPQFFRRGELGSDVISSIALYRF